MILQPAKELKVMLKQWLWAVATQLAYRGLQLWRTFNHLDNVYSGDSDFNPWYLVMGEPFKR